MAGADIDHDVLAELPLHLQREILRDSGLAAGPAASRQPPAQQHSGSRIGSASRGRGVAKARGSKGARGGKGTMQTGTLDAFICRK